MFGGLLVQWLMETWRLQHHIKIRTIKNISAMTLDLLIVTAIGTISLNAIGHNFAAFITMAIVGVVWILGAFVFLAPKFFHKHWFEYGMTDVGQAMGMTATGLLLNRLVDPLNRTGARESFAYKQLAYEPFMGGGIVTAFAVVAVVEFGLPLLLAISGVVFIFWLILGLKLGRKNRQRVRHDKDIADYAMRAS